MKEMENLICLQLHNNRINFLPRGIVELENLEDISLRWVTNKKAYHYELFSGNPLINRFVREITYSPPSLLELAGRSVIHHQADTTKLPSSLKQRLSHAKCCPNPNCDGVYFDNLYRQVKISTKSLHVYEISIDQIRWLLRTVPDASLAVFVLASVHDSRNWRLKVKKQP